MQKTIPIFVVSALLLIGGQAHAAENFWNDTTGEGYGAEPTHPYSADDIRYGPFSSTESDASWPVPASGIPGETNAIVSCILGMAETVSYDGKIYFVRPTDGPRLPFERNMSCSNVYGAFDNVWELDPIVGLVDGWNILRAPIPARNFVFTDEGVSVREGTLVKRAHAIGGAPSISGLGFGIRNDTAGGGQAALVGHEIYYFGGHQYFGAQFQFRGGEGIDEDFLNYRAYKYNILTDQWTDLGDLFGNLHQGPMISFIPAQTDGYGPQIREMISRQDELVSCLASDNPLSCPVYRSSIVSGSATYVPETGKIYIIGGYIGIKNDGWTYDAGEGIKISGNLNIPISQGQSIPARQRLMPNRIIWEYDLENNSYEAINFIDLEESTYRTINAETGEMGDDVLEKYRNAFDGKGNLAINYRERHKGLAHDGTIYITGGLYFEQQYLQLCAGRSGLMEVFYEDRCLQYGMSNTNTYESLFGNTWTFNALTNQLDTRAISGDPMTFTTTNKGDVVIYPADSYSDAAANRSTARIHNGRIYASIDANTLFLEADTCGANTGFCLFNPPNITANDVDEGTLFVLDLENSSLEWKKVDAVDERQLVLGPAVATIVDSGNEINYIIMGRELCKDGSCTRFQNALQGTPLGILGYPPTDFWMKFYTIEETLLPSCRIDPGDTTLGIGERKDIAVYVDPDGEGPLPENPASIVGDADIRWETTDNNVVRFNPSRTKIRGVAQGAVIIRAELLPSSTYNFASCAISVSVNPQSALTIDPSSDTIEVGESAIFRAKYDDGSGAERVLSINEAQRGIDGNSPVWQLFNNQMITTRLLGDANGDGKITSADVGIIQAGGVNHRNLTNFEKNIFDVNQDGIVSTSDALTVLSYLSGVSSYDGALIVLAKVPTNGTPQLINAEYIDNVATADLHINFTVPSFDGIVVDFNEARTNPENGVLGFENYNVPNWVNSFNASWSDPEPGQEDIAGWISSGSGPMNDVWIDSVGDIFDGNLRKLVEDRQDFRSDFYFIPKTEVNGLYEVFLAVANFEDVKTNAYTASLSTFTGPTAPPDFPVGTAQTGILSMQDVPPIDSGLVQFMPFPSYINVVGGPSTGGVKVQFSNEAGPFTPISGIVFVCRSVGGCDAEGPVEILGCTDSTAPEFDPTATVDDGSCNATTGGGNPNLTFGVRKSGTTGAFSNSATITSGESVELSWDSTGTTACNVKNDRTSTNLVIGGAVMDTVIGQPLTLLGTHLYTAECTKSSGGSITANLSVNVSPVAVGGSCPSINFVPEANNILKFLTPNILSLRRHLNIATDEPVTLTYSHAGVSDTIRATGFDNEILSALPKNFNAQNAQDIWIRVEINADTLLSPPGEYQGTLRAAHQSDASCFGELEIPFSIVDLGDIIEF